MKYATGELRQLTLFMLLPFSQPIELISSDEVEDLDRVFASWQHQQCHTKFTHVHYAEIVFYYRRAPLMASAAQRSSQLLEKLGIPPRAMGHY